LKAPLCGKRSGNQNSKTPQNHPATARWGERANKRSNNYVIQEASH
jgi:hypothetical protein